jgi:predicted HTH domain antitoxin
MTVSVEIPDEVAQKLSQDGHDPARAALEGIAIEGYRSGALTAGQTHELLGFGTRYELDGFLKSHNVMEGAYDIEDYEQDCQTIELLEKKRRETA